MRVAVALALILALPTVGAWDQTKGDAQRSGIAVVPPGPLDVVASGRLAEGGATQLVEVAGGAVPVAADNATAFLVHRGSSCSILFVSSFRPFASRSLPLTQCSGARLAAYDRTNDALLVLLAAQGSGPVALSVSASTGDVRWALAAPTSEAPAGAQALALALDSTRGIAYVGISGTSGGAYIDAIRVSDGSAIWSVPVSGAESAPLLGAAPAGNPNLSLRGLTLTAEGIVATGYELACTGCVADAGGAIQDAFAAWYTQGGVPEGFRTAKLGSPTDPSSVPAATQRSAPGSEMAVARGSVAALALGGEVLAINPTSTAPVGVAPIKAVESVSNLVFWETGVWTPNAIVLPVIHSLSAFDPTTLQPLWARTEGSGWFVVSVVQDSGNALDVLYASAGSDGKAMLVQYGPQGELLGKIPVPLKVQGTPEEDWFALLVPTHEGLVATDTNGEYALIGPADEGQRPQTDPLTFFPAPGQVERLDMSAPGTAGFAVSWGDGTYETLEGRNGTRATFFHTYVGRGARDVRVMALYPKGTTATRLLSLDVGGTPPPDLTPLQDAFAPENQNLTFGVLGIAVTLVGGAWTLARSRHRASLLDRELDRLDKLADLAARLPRDAARPLREYRDGLRPRLGKGILDEPQYHVLETRSARLMRALQAKLLDPFAASLSEPFRRRLAAALEDATIHPAERAGLDEALRAEPVDPETRSRLAAILDDFTSAT